MSFMMHDLRFALRMIASHRWFSAAVVATLALGIGLNTMVFTIVNAALFKPVPVPGGARLVSVATHMPDGRDTRMSWPDLLDYRAQAHSFEALEGASNLVDRAARTGELGKRELRSSGNAHRHPGSVAIWCPIASRYRTSDGANAVGLGIHSKPTIIVAIIASGLAARLRVNISTGCSACRW